ncbi:MAG: hypothetical protein L0215_19690 [Gemmataceae bacterium]|nr:hypothetical protein [Gemmataceae bacterium]
MVAPELMTFDIFGTVVDWRAGLRRDLAAEGIELSEPRFERLLADQERAERSHYFQKYADITTWSLVRTLGMPPKRVRHIGEQLGRWPLFPDAAEGLRLLLLHAPCVAITNSDMCHGDQVQEQLGYHLSGWICAEETQVYKPHPDCWRITAQRLGVEFGPSWWHVSAYGDYDLATARSLGLTTVFVNRPHARPGEADWTVSDLLELAQHVEQLQA